MPDVVKATAMDCEPVKAPPPRSRPPVAVAASEPVHGLADEARLRDRLVREQERPLTLKVVAEVVEIEAAPVQELYKAATPVGREMLSEPTLSEKAETEPEMEPQLPVSVRAKAAEKGVTDEELVRASCTE